MRKIVMRKARAFFIFGILFFVLSSVVFPQTKLFQSAKGLSKIQTDYEFDKWIFSVGNSRYEINKKGKGKKINGKKNNSNFNLNIQKDEEIERVIYYASYKNDLLILSEINAGGEGAGFIIRLNGKTLKPKWRTHIPDFGIGRGFIEGNFSYLTARAFIGKINLENGKFVWQHQRDFGLQSFGNPRLKGDLVIFPEDVQSGKNKIEVLKKDGKIIKIVSSNK